MTTPERPDSHKVRVLHPHTGWRDGDPCSEWGGRVGLFLDTYDGLQHVSRASDGTKRGEWSRWVPIGCNSVGCEFEALVSVRWIEEMVSDLTATASAKGHKR